MIQLKLITYSTLVSMLVALCVFADETAIIDGQKITVSGSKSAEERFKRYAKAHQQSADKERQFKRKIESANLGPLEPYITGVFMHGFDWSKLKQYEYMNTEPLFRLLDDPDWALHWDNVVAVIGAIADKKAAENLLEYIKIDKIEGKPYRHFMEAKSDSIAALGTTIQRGAYPEGIDFLKAHVIPGTWRQTLKNLNLSETRENRLHNQTIIVLSSIGTDEAVETLTKARDHMEEEYRKKHRQAGTKQDLKNHLRLIDFYIEKAKLGPLEERIYE